MGPTASGKTPLALALAQVLPVEIVSVDSAQIYRGMDVGTAKPSPSERGAAPHHLIDIIDPTQTYSAARFREDALRLVTEIAARRRIPLLVGGTMLYFKALREGLSDLPESDAEVRAEIDAAAAQRGWLALHAELAKIDPETAARLKPNDAQRIQRALEVIAAHCIGASRNASTRCLKEGSSKNCARCASATRCGQACLRCAASGIARRGSFWRGNSTTASCAAAESLPHASSPSAS